MPRWIRAVEMIGVGEGLARRKWLLMSRQDRSMSFSSGAYIGSHSIWNQGHAASAACEASAVWIGPFFFENPDDRFLRAARARPVDRVEAVHEGDEVAAELGRAGVAISLWAAQSRTPIIAPLRAFPGASARGSEPRFAQALLPAGSMRPDAAEPLGTGTPRFLWYESSYAIAGGKMPRNAPSYLRPGALERILGHTLVLLVRIGLIRGHFYVLEVRGRTSGRTISLPVDPLDLEGRPYLVCARGNANWVRNARTAGEVALARALRRRRYAVRELPPSLRPPVLKAYLDRFAGEVQRFFPVPKGSPVESFDELAPRYPVFELQPLDETAPGTGAAPR
jgi:hypothetical protein